MGHLACKLVATSWIRVLVWNSSEPAAGSGCAIRARSSIVSLIAVGHFRESMLKLAQFREIKLATTRQPRSWRPQF